MVNIRTAVAEDKVALKQIYKDCRDELGSFDLYMCWQKFLKGESKEKFLVAYEKGEVLGMIRFGPSRKYQVVVVQDIGVLLKARGKKIGQLLLDCVPKPYLLKCNEDNEGGNNFYKMMKLRCAGKTFTKKGRPQIIWTCVE
jgi:hypothetical protein